MIECSDLRPGNLVSCKHYGVHVGSIKEVIPKSGIILLHEMENYGTYILVNPIIITPYWLLRFGFTDPAQNGCGYRININSVDELCWYMDDNYLRYQTQGSGFSRQLKHIKHVHELQNWHYWFTGKELKHN